MDNNNNVNNEIKDERRRALAEALRVGEPVVVTPTGEVEMKDEANKHGMSNIDIPNGKLA